MLATLRGRVRHVADDHCILEVNGVGYQVLVPLNALEKLSQAEDEVLLYTYLHHKEDTMNLYGFLHLEEKNLFTQIITVSGVGPKTALAVFSVLSSQDFRRAVLTEDIGVLRTVPGIGMKNAQRLIIELKPRFVKEDGEQKTTSIPGLPFEDAVAALVALGYTSTVASGAVRKAWRENPNLNVPDLIRRALQKLSNNK